MKDFDPGCFSRVDHINVAASVPHSDLPAPGGYLAFINIRQHLGSVLFTHDAHVSPNPYRSLSFMLTPQVVSLPPEGVCWTPSGNSHVFMGGGRRSGEYVLRSEGNHYGLSVIGHLAICVLITHIPTRSPHCCPPPRRTFPPVFGPPDTLHFVQGIVLQSYCSLSQSCSSLLGERISAQSMYTFSGRPWPSLQVLST